MDRKIWNVDFLIFFKKTPSVIFKFLSNLCKKKMTNWRARYYIMKVTRMYFIRWSLVN